MISASHLAAARSIFTANLASNDLDTALTAVLTWARRPASVRDTIARRHAHVTEAAALAAHVQPEQITGGVRSATVSNARAVACYVLRARGLPWKEVAKAVKMKDHTSAMDAVAKVRARVDLIALADRVEANLSVRRPDVK